MAAICHLAFVQDIFGLPTEYLVWSLYHCALVMIDAVVSIK